MKTGREVRSTPRHRVWWVTVTAAVLLIGSASASLTAWAQGIPSDIFAALRHRHVYVAEAARPRLSDQAQAKLEAYARQRGSAGYALKMILLDRPPPGFRTLGQFVSAAHRALNLGDGIVIAVALDAGRGSSSVSAKTEALDDGVIGRVQQQRLGTFMTIGFAEGFQALADDLIQTIESQRRSSQTIKRVIATGVVLLALSLIGWRLRTRVRTWKRRLRATGELRDSLYPPLCELDEQMPYLAEGADTRTARLEQGQGAEHYLKGSGILDELGQLSWLGPALRRTPSRRLAEATSELSLAREHLLRAQAAVARAQRRRETPLVEITSAPEAAPSEAPEPRPSFRESCFFCSRPLPPDRRLLGMIDIGGQRRTVTVCDTHAADLEAGREPLIRGLNQGGQLIPWFAAPTYDPSRDYTPSYTGGLLPALLAVVFIEAAFGLSYASQQRPEPWYADDSWGDDDRATYWSWHTRGEHQHGWERDREVISDRGLETAPETSFHAASSAPETSFDAAPTAAETTFAQASARSTAADIERDQSTAGAVDRGSGTDQS